MHILLTLLVLFCRSPLPETEASVALTRMIEKRSAVNRAHQDLLEALARYDASCDAVAHSELNLVGILVPQIFQEVLRSSPQDRATFFEARPSEPSRALRHFLAARESREYQQALEPGSTIQILPIARFEPPIQQFDNISAAELHTHPYVYVGVMLIRDYRGAVVVYAKRWDKGEPVLSYIFHPKTQSEPVDLWRCNWFQEFFEAQPQKGTTTYAPVRIIDKSLERPDLIRI